MTSTPEPPNPHDPGETPKRIAQSWVLSERRELARTVRDALAAAARGEHSKPSLSTLADWLAYDAQLEALKHLVDRAPRN